MNNWKWKHVFFMYHSYLGFPTNKTFQEKMRKNSKIFLRIFLSFCLSIHNTYVQPWLWGYVFFGKIVVFLRNFRFIFSRNFRVFFREICAILCSRNFTFFCGKTDVSKILRKCLHFFAGNPIPDYFLTSLS